NRIAYVILSSAAAYAHFYSALLIIGHWLSLRFLRPEAAPKALGRDLRWIALLISPIILFIGTTGAGPLRWIQRPGIKDLWELAIHLAGNGGATLLLLYLLACGASIVPALRRIRLPALPREQWRYWFLLVWLLFPLLLILAVSLARPLFLARYFILSLPALVILAAAGLSRIPNRALLALAVLPFIALSLRGTLSYYADDFDIQRDDWRGASTYLLSQAQPTDGLVFFVAMGRMPYEYYYWLRSQPVGYPAVIYPYHGPRMLFLDFVEKPDYRALEQNVGGYQRIWFVISHANTGVHEDKPLSALSNLIATRCGGFEEKDFEGIKLRLYSCGHPVPSARLAPADNPWEN
ncbi:MAG: hypothetical protein JOY93_09770, partial [Acidobacteriales bacterium]|nr:hypothetical protein [Terriglobales bacterium]